jgi:hypothetical protein
MSGVISVIQSDKHPCAKSDVLHTDTLLTQAKFDFESNHSMLPGRLTLLLVLSTSFYVHSFIQCVGRRRINYLLAQPQTQEWNKVTRSELQELAKQHGVRANMKSADIIEALEVLGYSSAAVVSSIPDESGSLQDVLAEQGITWEDLVSLQAQYGSTGTVKARPREVTNKETSIKEPSHITSKPAALPATDQMRQLGTRAIPATAPSPSATQGGSKPATTRVTHKGTTLSSKNIIPFDEPSHEQAEPVTPRARASPSRPTVPPQRVSTTSVTLEAMLTFLVENMGFPALYAETKLKCFANRPTLASSLKVLRQGKVEWARRRIEHLYVTRKRVADN